MNTAEIKAIQNKMESDKQRLEEYFKGSRTTKEKVVANTIERIKKSEEKLIAAGIKLAEKINDDGTFTVLSKSENTTSTEEKNDNTIEVVETSTENETSDVKKNKASKKVTPTKKLRDNNTSSKPEVVKIGVTVKENIKLKLDTLAEDSNMKPNEAVVDLLGKLFDGKNFNIEFEKKEKTKVTSYNIPAAMDKALIKLNKSTGIPKTELFNRLLEEALREFFE